MCSKKKKNKNQKEEHFDCSSCENCIYIGDGDHICGVNNKLILDEFMPTSRYGWCRGKHYT